MPFTGRLMYKFENLSWFAHPCFHSGMTKEPSSTQNEKSWLTYGNIPAKMSFGLFIFVTIAPNITTTTNI